MILYIIKSILCSALFIAAYYLLLEKERIHRFKRWYLLSTLLLSLGIPLITIEVAQPELATQVGAVSQYVAEYIPYLPEESHVTAAPENTSTGFSWPIILLIGYGIITVVLVVRILNNFLSILADVKGEIVTEHREALLVLHEKHVIPYSFLNYIFISPQDVSNKHILLHELTHIRQKHTLDILLVEFIHCLMWFNPAILFYKKAIRLNHEFLADEVVIKNFPTSDYQNILFQKTQTSNRLALTSSFNYSATKKRFIMMTALKNQTRSSLKMILASVIIAGAIVVFTEKTYAQTDSTSTDSTGQVTENVPVSMDSSLVYFDCVYNKMRQKLVARNGTERIVFNTTGISDECKAYLLSIYNSMTQEQKDIYVPSIAKILSPIPHPKKQSPTAEQLLSWTDAKVYGVWIDSKRINNETLKNYSATDFSLFSVSRLLKNAYTPGKHTHQVDLFTNEHFRKSYPAKSN